MYIKSKNKRELNTKNFQVLFIRSQEKDNFEVDVFEKIWNVIYWKPIWVRNVAANLSEQKIIIFRVTVCF